MSEHFQPITIDAVNVILPHVNQRHVQTAFGQQAAKKTAHRPGPYDCNSRSKVAH
jgi:hypothetical protein